MGTSVDNSEPVSPARDGGRGFETRAHRHRTKLRIPRKIKDGLWKLFGLEGGESDRAAIAVLTRNGARFCFVAVCHCARCAPQALARVHAHRCLLMRPALTVESCTKTFLSLLRRIRRVRFSEVF